MTTQKTTQVETVLRHLDIHGYITDLVAQSYGVRRLAARIYDIERKRDITIAREMRYNDVGQRYTYYTYAG